jgi:hypothetical protein
MGTGTAWYRIENWTRLKRVGRGLLQGLQILLYVAFMADCLVLVAGEARMRSYEPYGGGSLIVLLLAIGIIGRILYGDTDDFG